MNPLNQPKSLVVSIRVNPAQSIAVTTSTIVKKILGICTRMLYMKLPSDLVSPDLARFRSLQRNDPFLAHLPLQMHPAPPCVHLAEHSLIGSLKGSVDL